MAVYVGDGIFPVMDVMTFGHGAFEGTVRFTDGILENVLAVHPHGIIGGKARDFFSGGIEIGNPPLLVCGKKPIGEAVQDFNETFFLLVEPFKGFDVVLVNLVGQELIPSSWMLFTFDLEIGAVQAVGQFLEKIFFKEIPAVGFGNQPTVITFLFMGRAQDVAAGQQLPTGLLGEIILFSLRQFDEMIFEQ